MAQFTVDLAKIFKRTTTSLLIICFWVLWATRAQAASDVLLYNPTNGSATTGRIEADGQFSSSFYFPSGSFANWSHVVRASNGLLFFYQQTDGSWAVGRPDDTVGFVTLHTGSGLVYDPLAGDTKPNFHVISTPDGIVINRAYSPINYNYGGLIGRVRSSGLFEVTQYFLFTPATNMVSTPNGIFLMTPNHDNTRIWHSVFRIQSDGTYLQTSSGYIDINLIEHEVVAIGNDLIFLPHARSLGLSLSPQLSGSYRLGGISSDGKFALRNRTWCASSLAGGNVIPVVLGNDLLMYSVSDGFDPAPGLSDFTRLMLGGWAQINTFQQPSNFIPYACWGQLKTKYELPEGYFSRGWSKIVHTANGTLMHNPDDGATVVGSFNADGTFSQLSYNLVDTGYTMVIKMTE